MKNWNTLAWDVEELEILKIKTCLRVQNHAAWKQRFDLNVLSGFHDGLNVYAVLLWSGQRGGQEAAAAVPGLSLLSSGESGQSKARGSYLSAHCSRDGLCWHTSQMPQGA